MHPLGCFGSTLAFDPTSSTCGSCSGMAACEAKVQARHPQMQRLLARFSDVKGDPMSVHWMNKDEKRQWKQDRKDAALREAEGLTYGSPAVAAGIKAKLDTRVHALVNRLTFDGVNLMTADHSKLAKSCSAMAAVLDVLRSKPRASMNELTAAVGLQTRVSDGTAQRDAYAAVSILTSCDRAQRNGPIVELK